MSSFGTINSGVNTISKLMPLLYKNADIIIREKLNEAIYQAGGSVVEINSGQTATADDFVSGFLTINTGGTLPTGTNSTNRFFDNDVFIPAFTKRFGRVPQVGDSFLVKLTNNYGGGTSFEDITGSSPTVPGRGTAVGDGETVTLLIRWEGDGYSLYGYGRFG